MNITFFIIFQANLKFYRAAREHVVLRRMGTEAFGADWKGKMVSSTFQLLILFFENF